MRRMNTLGRAGLVAAMENEEVVTPEAETQIEGGAESLETDLIEVQADDVAAADQEVQIEEAVETAEALESIAVAMEAAAQNGGLNKDAAQVVSVALEAMYKSVGISTVKPMPALESFGQTSSRIGATNLAMEDIKEQIKKIWEAIVKAVLNSIDWLVDRFQKMFLSADKLKARAEALKTKAGTIKEAKPAAAEFEQQRIASALHVAGKLNVKADLAATKSMAEFVLSTDVSRAQAIVKALESKDVDAAVKAFSSTEAASKLKASPAGSDHAAAAGVVVLRTPEMPGGQSILLHALDKVDTSNTAGALTAIASVKMGLAPFDPKAKAPAAKVKTLTPSEAGDVAGEVVGLAEVVAAFKKGLESIKTEKKKVVSAIQGLAKSQKSDESKADETKALQKLAAAVPRLIDALPAQFASYTLNTGKAACDYVELSLKQYGGEAAKPAEEAK